MSKRAGDHTRVRVDDATGTSGSLTDISAYVTSVDIPDAADQHDVTGMEAVHNFVVGQQVQEVTLNGVFHATVHAVMVAIAGKPGGVTMDIALGDNVAPTTGDPIYTGEFNCDRYQVNVPNNGPVTWSAHFSKFNSTAAAWGTM